MKGQFIQMIIPTDFKLESIQDIIGELITGIATKPDEFTLKSIFDYLVYKAEKGDIPFPIRSEIVDMEDFIKK